MSTAQGARARARTEVTAAIKTEARRQLTEGGAAGLSLRAVARALGMASSALYRYFPSRDELLTALIIDAYDAVGEVAEQARDATAGAAPARRWVEVCAAVRDWALAHPHEYALIYGSPVPGYTAPQATVPAAARIGHVLIGILRDARRTGALAVPPVGFGLRPETERMAADLAPDLPPGAVAALVAGWAQLFGLISFELFGHFSGVVEERADFFRHAAARLADGVGLTEPADRTGVLPREQR